MQFNKCVHGSASRNYLCTALVMSELLMLHKEIFQAQSKHCGKYLAKTILDTVIYNYFPKGR